MISPFTDTTKIIKIPDRMNTDKNRLRELFAKLATKIGILRVKTKSPPKNIGGIALLLVLTMRADRLKGKIVSRMERWSGTSKDLQICSVNGEPFSLDDTEPWDAQKHPSHGVDMPGFPGNKLDQN